MSLSIGRRILPGLAAVATMAVLAQSATAQDRGNPGWYVRVMPYIWFSNIDGINSLGDISLQVGDSVLETSFAADVEVGKGRWRGIASFRTTSLSGPTALEGNDVPAGTQVTYDFSETTGELFAAVQVGSFLSSHALEALGGVRYVRHSQKIADAPQPVDADAEWIEPVVGARYFAELGGGFRATLTGDLGGFGVGSEFTWRAGGQLAFRLARPIDIALAYKYLQAEYQNESTGYAWDEGVSQGWYVGVVIKR